MTPYLPTAAFEWFLHQGNNGGPAEFVARVGPFLAPLCRAGDRVLDLCCGVGAVTFFLEELGARVTGIEMAPDLVLLARREAARRNSRAEFIQANAFTHPFGEQVYDLIICLGDVLPELSPARFAALRDRVGRALKRCGRFAIQYFDGVARLMALSAPGNALEQGTRGRIWRHFIDYDPAAGRFVSLYQQLGSGETCQYSGYVYSGAMIRLAMEATFDLESSTRLEEMSFLDVFVRRGG